MRKLYIYMNDNKAGVLTEMRQGNGYTFCYDDEYVASDNPAISVTLPKQRSAYESDYLFPVFTNMIPEGANRRAICRTRQIDESDFFGILEALADKDFIGALQVKRMTDD